MAWEAYEGIIRLLGEGLLILSTPSIYEGMSYIVNMDYIAWPQAPAIETEVSCCKLSRLCYVLPGNPLVQLSAGSGNRRLSWPALATNHIGEHQVW